MLLINYILYTVINFRDIIIIAIKKVFNVYKCNNEKIIVGVKAIEYKKFVNSNRCFPTVVGAVVNKKTISLVPRLLLAPNIIHITPILMLNSSIRIMNPTRIVSKHHIVEFQYIDYTRKISNLFNANGSNIIVVYDSKLQNVAKGGSAKIMNFVRKKAAKTMWKYTSYLQNGPSYRKLSESQFDKSDNKECESLSVGVTNK